MKKTLADRISQQIRRFILIGDNREAELACAQLVPDVFERIAYRSTSDGLIFDLPLPTSRDRPSSAQLWPSIRSGQVIVPIGLGNGAPSGAIEFVFNRFANLELAFGLWLLWLMASIPLGLRLRQGIENRLTQESELRRLAAAAQTTQMLAHDIRRPFSLIDIGLRRMKDAKGLRELQSNSRRLANEVELARKHVDGMLQDIIDADGKMTLDPVPVELSEVLSGALTQVFVDPGYDIAIESQLEHRNLVAIDVPRTERALINIIENAAQAMNGAGRLWLRTCNIETAGGGAQVQLVIGNDGPAIPDEDIDDLFEPFYTKGKRGGSGLGLAIAKKVISLQGGAITCALGRPSGVEFVLTFPTTTGATMAAVNSLPSHSGAFSNSMVGLEAAGPAPPRTAQNAADELPCIALIEDNFFVQDAWHARLRDARLELFRMPADFLDRVTREPAWAQSLYCVVTDQNFGPMSTMNGVGLAERLKALLPKLPVILSTNDSPTLSGAVDAQIGKEPLDVRDLRALISALRHRTIDALPLDC